MALQVSSTEEQAEGMKDDLILTLHEEAPITLNAELIKQMTTPELVKLWKVILPPPPPPSPLFSPSLSLSFLFLPS